MANWYKMGEIIEKYCNLEPITFMDLDPPLNPAPMLEPDPVIPIPDVFAVIPIPAKQWNHNSSRG